ncbi:MAG TPA: hypothetical protein VEQ64_03320 [Xanthobacteraceae bacterium]|jgi:hypothetical protein|nr:hypothetical protein [Xanthobacteraceae bacterium]
MRIVSGRSGDTINMRALTREIGVKLRTAPVVRLMAKTRQFSSPLSSERKRMCAPSQAQSCQAIGRPVTRVSGSAAPTSSAGASQTLSTPSNGASHVNHSPSGLIRA